jgi:DnaJ-class molecular chaperone
MCRLKSVHGDGRVTTSDKVGLGIVTVEVSCSTKDGRRAIVSTITVYCQSCDKRHFNGSFLSMRRTTG